MRRSSIANAKNQLSRLLDAVRAGESVLILDRDRPVARLEPVADAAIGELPDALARLERAGMLRRASAPLPDDFLDDGTEAVAEAGTVGTVGDALLDALLDDRRHGR